MWGLASVFPHSISNISFLRSLSLFLSYNKEDIIIWEPSRIISVSELQVLQSFCQEAMSSGTTNKDHHPQSSHWKTSDSISKWCWRQETVRSPLSWQKFLFVRRISTLIIWTHKWILFTLQKERSIIWDKCNSPPKPDNPLILQTYPSWAPARAMPPRMNQVLKSDDSQTWKRFSAKASTLVRSRGRERGQEDGKAQPSPNFCVHRLFKEKKRQLINLYICWHNIPTLDQQNHEVVTWIIGSRSFWQSIAWYKMSFSKPSTLARLNDDILGCFGYIQPSETLDHLVRFLGTWSGGEWACAYMRSRMSWWTIMQQSIHG